MNGALDWVGHHGMLLEVLALVGGVSLLASVALLPVLVVRIPADYFYRRDRRGGQPLGRNPLVHRVIVISKNALGAVLVLAGIAMLVLPGQGLLTLLIGLMLTDFPGKYLIEKRIVAQPGVLKAINWLRQRAGHPPLLAPADQD